MNNDLEKAVEGIVYLQNLPHNRNYGHRMVEGEPEEGVTEAPDLNDDEYDDLDQNIKDSLVFTSLVAAKSHLYLGVDKAIQFQNNQRKEYGSLNRGCIEVDYWNWFSTGDLQTLFKRGAIGKDGNLYIDFILTIVRSTLSNPKVLEKESSHFVDGKPVQDRMSLQKYILSKFKLDKDNEIHKKFSSIVKKICDYFDRYEKEIRDITNECNFDEDLIALKQELLDEDPEQTKNNFIQNDIDELIQYNAYHVNGVDEDIVRELFNLVTLVIYNNDTLQDIPDLTAESDWKSIIYNYYDVEGDYETPWEEQEPSEFEHGITDITPDDLAHWNQDAIEREQLEGASRGGKSGGAIGGKIGGKASKRNHTKSVTIRNIKTGEEFTFEDTIQCYTFLGVSKKTYNNFKQGKKTKLNDIWQLI